MADIDFGTGPNTNTGDNVRQALVKLQNRVGTVDTLVAQLNNTIAQRDATIASKDGTIAQRNATIAALNAQIVILNARIAELEAGGGGGTPDTTAPTLNGPFAFNVAENTAFSAQLTGSEGGTYSLIAGLDGAPFGLTSSGLLTLPAQNFEVPGDVGTGSDNTFQVQVRLTDNANNASQIAVYTVTVTNVAEGDGPAPTLDNSLVPLYIQLDTDRDAAQLSILVFTDKTHDVGGSIWTYAYPTAALTNPTILKVTPTDGQAASVALAEINAGLAALTGTQRVECFWVTADNRISRPSNRLLWGANDVAPVVSAPSGFTNVTSAAATFGASTDMVGGTFYTVVTANNVKPSKLQLEQGKDSAGATAAFAQGKPVAQLGAQSFTASGLTDDDTFYVWYAHKPAVGPTSEVLAGGSFTTAAASVFSYAHRAIYSVGSGIPGLREDVPIGPASPNRQVVIASFQYGDTPGFLINGTIQATRVGPPDSNLGFYTALVPTGETMDIEFQSGFMPGKSVISIWTVDGGQIQLPASANTGGFQEAAQQTISPVTPDGHASLGFGWHQSGAPTGVSGATYHGKSDWTSNNVDFGAGYAFSRVGPSSAPIAYTGSSGSNIQLTTFNFAPAA